MRGVALISIMFLLAGCRGEVPPQPSSKVAAASSTSATSDAAPIPTLPPDSLRDDLVVHGLLIPLTGRRAVIAQLGPPDSVRSQSEQNLNIPGQTDSTVHLFYRGLQLHYYVVTGKDGRDLLQSADVWDNRYLKYPAVGVGANAAVLVAALGEPLARVDDAYSYECGSCIGADEPVYFHLAAGRVRFVEYTFYTG